EYYSGFLNSPRTEGTSCVLFRDPLQNICTSVLALCSLGGNLYTQIIQKTQGGERQLHINRPELKSGMGI
ncbi:hypothetical protein PROFUN_14391, partial [Planoprotostelium fungivorum]